MASHGKTKPHPTIPGARVRVRDKKQPVLRSIEPPAIPARKDARAEIERLTPKADLKKVEEFTSVTAQELADVRAKRPRHLTTEEKLAILEMFQLGYAEQLMAARLDRSPDAISAFLRDFKPTTILAKAVFEAKAEALAHRVVKHADVDQSLEVMDRLGVLKKTSKDTGGVSNQFQIIVGGAGGGSGSAALPVPTQADIIAVASEPSE